MLCALFGSGERLLLRASTCHAHPVLQVEKRSFASGWRLFSVHASHPSISFSCFLWQTAVATNVPRLSCQRGVNSLAPHVRHRQHIGAPTEAAFPSKRQQFFRSSVVGLEIGATNVLHELRLIPGTSPHRSGRLSLRSERCAGGGSSATALLPNHPERRRSTPYAVNPRCRDLLPLHRGDPRWGYSGYYS